MGRSFDSTETVVLIAKAPGVWPLGFADAGSVPRQPLMHLGLAFCDSVLKANNRDKNKLLYKNVN